jgi:serine/threonine protein kinase
MKQPLYSNMNMSEIDERDKLRLQMDFLNEVNLFIQASRGNHPNIVQFKGAHFSATDGKSYLLIEYCSEKDLRSFLKKHGSKLNNLQRFDMLLQCACALEYLHAQGIIHRDVKSSNFLVFPVNEGNNNNNGNSSELNHYRIKVTDFGISKSSILITGTHCGTRLYTAPELMTIGNTSTSTQMNELLAIHARDAQLKQQYKLEEEQSSLQMIDPFKCDVYSLAFIMYELWSLQVPYSDTIETMNGDFVRLEMKIRDEQLRPSMDPFQQCPATFVTLMQQCWSSNPAERPTMNQVVQRLNGIYRALVIQ